MYDALLTCNYTSFEISFRPYSEHIHRIYASLVHLKAFFFSKKKECFTWPLEAHIPLKELLFLFLNCLEWQKAKSSFNQELTFNIKTSYCAD